jgi:transcriptional regulator with XRE-family HTH domain
MKDKIRNLADLGSQLKALRLASGLGVVDIAQKSGRSRDVLNRLEKGGDASLSSVLALLQALGHTIEIVPLGRPSLQEMRRRFALDDDEEADGGSSDEPGNGGLPHG